jgi:hypothetical protein
VKNLNAIGNVKSLLVLNQNVSWFVKIQIAYRKSNAAHVLWELLLLLNHSHSLKKLKLINNVVNAKNRKKNENMIIINKNTFLIWK